MRDIFTEIFENQPLDPMVSARQGGKPKALKRFYQAASVSERAPHIVLLDGKPVQTPARRALAAPNMTLAQKIADEWNAQGEKVLPATMPLTRLANVIIDAVADAPAPVVQEIENYLGTDLICYRAEAPAGLIEQQKKMWDPLIAFAREQLGARFALAQGVVPIAQPREAIAAAVKTIPSHPNSLNAIWRLGALASVTTLTGSALIALALAARQLTPEQAWAAAHVDEDWQMSQWGHDEAALVRRAHRYGEMAAAAKILELVPAA